MKKMISMEGGNEIKGLTQVYSSVFVCLAFSYYVVRKMPNGLVRFIALLPIISIFVYLPLLVSSIHFTIVVSGTITWICSFKLVLFAFDQGPLSCDRNISFFHFIPIACLPIQVQQQSPPDNVTKKSPQSTWAFYVKVLLLLLIIQAYNYRQYMHHNVISFLYFNHVYLALELMLAILAVPARIVFGFELEPQFHDPFMATSLQDFWGRRWNLMISKILRPMVYQPIRWIYKPIMGPKWALLSGMLATFLVSGLMHELMYFYMSRVRPTWEVTMFFVLHGVCTSLEIQAKKVYGGRYRVHPIISRVLTISFIMVTSFWLFFPQWIRYELDVRSIHEYSLLVKFLKGAIFSAST